MPMFHDLIMGQDPQDPNPPTGPVIPQASSDDEAELFAQWGREAEERDKRFMAGYRVALRSDPTMVAEARKIASGLGIAPELAESDITTAREVAKAQALRLRASEGKFPSLMRQMEDVQFVRIAHDDLDNLSTTESTFGVLGDFYASGQRQDERGMLGFRVMRGVATQEDYDRLYEIDIEEAETQKRGSGPVRGSAQILGQMSRVFSQSLALASSVGATTSVVATPAAGAAAFTTTMVGATFFMQSPSSIGNAYWSMIQQGIKPEIARASAIPSGMTEAAFEAWAGKILLAPFKKATAKFIAGRASAALATPTSGGAWLNFVKDYSKSLAGEVLTESAQEAQAFVWENIALERSGKPTRGVGELVDDVVDVAGQTATGMALLALPGPAFRLLVDARAVRAGEAQADVFRQMAEDATGSKLSSRDKAAYEKSVGDMAEKAGVPTVFVEGNKLAEVLNALEQSEMDENARSAGVNKEDIQQFLDQDGKILSELEELVPGITGKLKDAAASGDFVAIPTGVWMSSLAKTKFAKALAPFVTFETDPSKVKTPEQAEQYRQEYEANIKSLTEIAELDTAFQDATTELGRVLGDQLQGVGKLLPSQSSSAKDLARSWFVTQAIQWNGNQAAAEKMFGKPFVTPMDVYAKFPLKIGVGEMQVTGLGSQASAVAPVNQFEADPDWQAVIEESDSFAEDNNRLPLEYHLLGYIGERGVLVGRSDITGEVRRFDVAEIQKLKEDRKDRAFRDKEREDLKAARATNDPNILNAGSTAQYSVGEHKITLTKEATVGEFVHELSHFWVDATMQMAQDLNAPDFVKRDAEALLEFFRLDTPEDWNALSQDQRAKFHEQIAYNAPIYFSEGKAPSKKLEGVFSRMKRWMVNLYKSIRGQMNKSYKEELRRRGLPEEDLPILTGEVRQWFDRMVATEEAINRSEAIYGMAPILEGEKPDGLTDAEWAEYQEFVTFTHDEALQRLDEKSLKATLYLQNKTGKVRGEVHKEAQRLRAGVRADVAKEVQSSQPYQAMRFLRDGVVVEADGSANKIETEDGKPIKLLAEDVRRYFGLAKEKKPKSPRAVNMITAIKKFGGISRESWDKDFPGERKKEFRIPGVVKAKGGMTWENMAQALAEEGYGPQVYGDVGPADYEWFVDAMADAAGGVNTYRMNDYESMQMMEQEQDRSAPEPDDVREARLKDEADRQKKARSKMRSLGYNDRGILAVDGRKADEIAEVFGFQNGNQLIEFIVNAKPIDEEIEARTDARMIAEYSEISDPKSLEEAVAAALHNEIRVRMVALESKAMSESTQPIRLTIDAAKRAGERIINKTRVGDISPAKHAQNAARARRDTEKHRAKGDTAKAIQTKHQEILQIQMVGLADKAKREVDKSVKRVNAAFASDKKLGEDRNYELALAARYVAAIFGFGPKGDATIAKARQSVENIGLYDEGLRDQMLTLVSKAEGIAESMAIKSEAPPRRRSTRDNGPSYKDLTLDEFRDVVDLIEGTWMRAKRAMEIELGNKKMTLAAGKQALVKELSERGAPDAATNASSSAIEKGSFLKGIRAMATRIEPLFLYWDGGKPGAWTNLVWRPLQDATVRMRDRWLGLSSKFVDLLKSLDIEDGKIDATKELGFTFDSMHHVLHALMHMGSETGRKHILLADYGNGKPWGDAVDGGLIDQSRWNAFIERLISEGKLNKSHFEFIEKVFELTDGTKKDFFGAWRKVFGYGPKQVGSIPITNSLGTFKGGYVPAKIDRSRAPSGDDVDAQMELLNDIRSMHIGVRSGAGIDRNGSTLPLRLDLRGIVDHFSEISRFIEIQPVMMDVLKLVRSDDVQGAMNRIDQEVWKGAIKPYLQRVAQQITSIPGTNKKLDDLARGLRKRTGLNTMVLNLSNIVQQVTGITVVATKVKKGHLMGAVARYLGNPRKMASDVASMSKYMDERMKNQMFDISSDLKKTVEKQGKLAKIQDYVSRKGYKPQAMVQNMVDTVAWSGAYDQAMAELGNMDPAAAQKEAVQRADAVVRITQGSLNPESLSVYEAGTPLQQLFTQFQSYFIALANNNYWQFKEIKESMGWVRGSAGLAAVAFFGAYVPFAVSQAIMSAFAGKLDSDEDEDGWNDLWFEALINAPARGSLGMVPFAGPLAVAFLNRFNNKWFDDRLGGAPAFTAIEAGFTVAARMGQAAFDPEAEIRGTDIRNFGTLLGLATGVPVNWAVKPFVYDREVSRGAVEPVNNYDALRGYVTGTASPESKQ